MQLDTSTKSTLPQTPQHWIPRFRFSLRTLLFFVLLIGSGATLWWNWGPWRVAFTVEEPYAINQILFSNDDQFVMFHYLHSASTNGVSESVNGLDIRHVSNGQRYALLTDLSGTTDDVLVRGSYALFYFSNPYAAQPVNAPQRLFNWVDQRELKNLPYLNGTSLSQNFDLRRENVLIRSEKPSHKAIVYRLPGFEKEWESTDATTEPNGAILLDDGRLAAMVNGRIEVHDFKSGSVLRSPKIDGRLDALERKGDDRFICALIGDAKPRVTYAFDLQTGTLTCFSSGSVQDISPDGKRAVMSAKLIDVATQKLIANVGQISGVHFDLDSSVVWRQAPAAGFDAVTGAQLWDHEGSMDVCGNGTSLSIGLEILDLRTGQLEMRLHGNARHSNENDRVIWGRSTATFAVQTIPVVSSVPEVWGPELNRSSVWVLHRPYQWYGIAWLPEFWMTFVFSIALIWSLWLDRRMV